MKNRCQLKWFPLEQQHGHFHLQVLGERNAYYKQVFSHKFTQNS